MRMLVLGGTAFLSAAVVELALERGHQVSCLNRGRRRSHAPGAELIAADRDRGEVAYAGATGEWDAVVDVTWQPAHARDAVAVLGGRSAHWAFVSSASVYADHDVPGAEEGDALLPAYGQQGPAQIELYGEAKVACEVACAEAVGDRLQVCRPGLIAGRGDPSDRFGYWPARFARPDSGDVLVPDRSEQWMQVIGVADLARWLVDSAESKTVGTFNLVGDPMPLSAMINRVQHVCGSTAAQVAVDPDWLVQQQVNFWAGPRSLPLWLPSEGYTGFGARSNKAAKAAGLQLSTLADVVKESLGFEQELGVDRERTAGLSRETEAALLAAWSARSDKPVAGPEGQS